MIDLEPIKARDAYATEMACSKAEEGVWCAAVARSQLDVPKLVAEVEYLREELSERCQLTHITATNYRVDL